MINRLIDISIKMPTHNEILKNPGIYTVEEYVRVFLENLSKTQKDRFKKMIENGIETGKSIADSYGIDYTEFIKELKVQLKVQN